MQNHIIITWTIVDNACFLEEMANNFHLAPQNQSGW